MGGCDGEGPTLRNKACGADGLSINPQGEKFENLYELFALGGLVKRPTAPCFGSRVRDDGTVGEYEWQSYQEVSLRVDCVAAALHALELAPRTADGNRFLGFFLKNSRDWMVTCLACFKTGITVVPMYDTLGADVVSYIQGQTGASSVLCSAAELKVLKRECPFRCARSPRRRPLPPRACASHSRRRSVHPPHQTLPASPPPAQHRRGERLLPRGGARLGARRRGPHQALRRGRGCWSAQSRLTARATPAQAVRPRAALLHLGHHGQP